MPGAPLALFETPEMVTGDAGGGVGGVGATSRQRIRRLVPSEKQTRPFASRAI